jgi:hypothetical protein
MNASLSDLDSCANEPVRVSGTIQLHGRMRTLDAHRRENRVIVGFERWAVDRGTQAPSFPLARHFLPQPRRDAGPASAKASCSVDRSA